MREEGFEPRQTHGEKHCAGLQAAQPQANPYEKYEVRGIELLARMERFEDCLRTVCHHLQLPQSESGPCDDPRRYDRELEGLIEQLNIAEAERTLAQERRFRAEAALQPFADAGKGLSDIWADARRAASIAWEGLKVEHFRKAAQALAVNGRAALQAEPNRHNARDGSSQIINAARSEEPAKAQQEGEGE